MKHDGVVLTTPPGAVLPSHQRRRAASTRARERRELDRVTPNAVGLSQRRALPQPVRRLRHRVGGRRQVLTGNRLPISPDHVVNSGALVRPRTDSTSRSTSSTSATSWSIATTPSSSTPTRWSTRRRRGAAGCCDSRSPDITCSTTVPTRRATSSWQALARRARSCSRRLFRSDETRGHTGAIIERHRFAP